MHDYFANYGGGERLVDILSKRKDLLIYGFVNKEIKKKIKTKAKQISLLNYKVPDLIKKIILIIKFFLLKIPNCTNCICSGNYSLFSNLKNAKNKVIYVHSLPKIFFKYNLFYKKNFFKYLIYIFFKKIYLYLYIKKLNSFKCIISNSNFTKKSLKKITNKKIFVIYPPIKKNKIKKIFIGDFYLSNNRHEVEKNIDKIILAFQKMKDKKLIITSQGSLTKKYIKLAKKFTNIKFVGLVNDKKYFNLLKKCRALINVTNNEDFGMSAIEGMSYGKITFCINEGGYKETTINNFNSIHVKKNNIVEDLVNKIQTINTSILNKLGKNCIKTSKKFSEEKFFKRLNNLATK